MDRTYQTQKASTGRETAGWVTTGHSAAKKPAYGLREEGLKEQLPTVGKKRKEDRAESPAVVGFVC